MLNYSELKIDSMAKDFVDSFQQLPPDNYLKSEYIFRKRRFSIVTFSKTDCKSFFCWSDEINTFIQSKNINTYAGDIERKYEPLSNCAKNFFETTLLPIAQKNLPNNNYQFGIHQIRITANEIYMGKPAPEGIHQDGFDYVMVAMINGYNFTGGNSILLDAQNNEQVLYDKILQPGECLLFNDRQFKHYASPIVPKTPGACFRDVLVTTFSIQD